MDLTQNGPELSQTESEDCTAVKDKSFDISFTGDVVQDGVARDDWTEDMQKVWNENKDTLFE